MICDVRSMAWMTQGGRKFSAMLGQRMVQLYLCPKGRFSLRAWWQIARSSMSSAWPSREGQAVVAAQCKLSIEYLRGSRLTPRWSQRRLPLEFMDGLGYTTIIEFAEPLARRRGSALDR